MVAFNSPQNRHNYVKRNYDGPASDVPTKAPHTPFTPKCLACNLGSLIFMPHGRSIPLETTIWRSQRAVLSAMIALSLVTANSACCWRAPDARLTSIDRPSDRPAPVSAIVSSRSSGTHWGAVRTLIARRRLWAGTRHAGTLPWSRQHGSRPLAGRWLVIAWLEECSWPPPTNQGDGILIAIALVWYEPNSNFAIAHHLVEAAYKLFPFEEPHSKEHHTTSEAGWFHSGLMSRS